MKKDLDEDDTAHYALNYDRGAPDTLYRKIILSLKLSSTLAKAIKETREIQNPKCSIIFSSENEGKITIGNNEFLFRSGSQEPLYSVII